MQNEKKVFQPKIIIGSIVSFIAAALGVVAVFFPDLLNLQKKKLNEAEFILQSEADYNKTWEFVSQHQGQAIKLSIGFCPEQREESIRFWLEVPGNYLYQKKLQKSNAIALIGINPSNGKEFYPRQFPSQMPLSAFLPNMDIEETSWIVSQYSINLKNLKPYDLIAGYDTGYKDFYNGLRTWGEIANINADNGIDIENITFNYAYATNAYGDEVDNLVIKVKGKENVMARISREENKDDFIERNSMISQKLPALCKEEVIHRAPLKVLGYMSGYFFVENLKERKYEDLEGPVVVSEKTLVLDPISQKEFELKNY